MQGNMLKTTVFFDESFFGKFNRLGGFKGTIVAICYYCTSYCDITKPHGRKFRAL